MELEGKRKDSILNTATELEYETARLKSSLSSLIGEIDKYISSNEREEADIKLLEKVKEAKKNIIEAQNELSEGIEFQAKD